LTGTWLQDLELLSDNMLHDMLHWQMKLALLVCYMLYGCLASGQLIMPANTKPSFKPWTCHGLRFAGSDLSLLH
jgi:hypothetical protein